MEGEDDTQVEVPETADTDTDTDPATSEAPATGEAPAPADKSTFDQFLEARPEWLEAAMRHTKASDVSEEDLAKLGATPEGQRVLAAVFARADAGLPDFEERQRAVAEKERELAAREQLVKARLAQGMSWSRHDKAKALLAKLAPATTAEEPEQFTPEWFAWQADRQAHARFEQFFSAMQEIEQDQLRELEEQRAAEAADAQAQRDAEFCEAHQEELGDPRVLARVTTLVQKHAHDIPEALQIALREVAIEDDAQAREQALARSRERVTRGGTRGPKVPSAPADPKDHHDFYTRNPEALQRDFDRAFPGWRDRMES